MAAWIYLFSGDNSQSLEGRTRLSTLLGVTAAVKEYLHSGLGQCVVHHDVKSANVLLTENFDPVPGDFSLARLIKHNHTATATVAGTAGYVTPEVVFMGKVTDKAVSGCHAEVLALEAASDYVYLAKHLSQQDHLINVIDPTILQLELLSNADIFQVQQQWKHVPHLALLCCHNTPESRPDMRFVNQEILNIITSTADDTFLILSSHQAQYMNSSTNPNLSEKSPNTSWTASSTSASTLNLYNVALR